jgi:hypothetical protein
MACATLCYQTIYLFPNLLVTLGNFQRNKNIFMIDLRKITHRASLHSVNP